MAEKPISFVSLRDPEVLGEIASEAIKDLNPKIKAAELRLRAALGHNWELFLQYEELTLQAMNQVQCQTVERMYSVAHRFSRRAA